MNASALPDQNVKFAVQPGAACQLVRGSAREHLEIDFRMRVGGDDVNSAARIEPLECLPATHQGFGTQEPARVYFAVGPGKGFPAA